MDGSEYKESRGVWVADCGDGTYRNPIIYADYSDPDVVRVGDDFYMVSSSFNCMPGIPVLHSKDLVNWRIIGHVYERLGFERFDKPQHGRGSWAPAIRYHRGEFLVFFCTPDEGLFMAKTEDAAGAWSELVHIREAVNWEDPCPLWDDDGEAYLVRSQWGGGPLFLHRMSADGRELLDDGVKIFEDVENQPILEGPKFLKRGGYYYIFAAAGGVSEGWQSVLRAKEIYGPYEARIVLQQGGTCVNGPHQGGIVELSTGEWWFVHFQDRGAYGRIVHLEPVRWFEDWPIIGKDEDGDGIGEPVGRWKKPDVGGVYPVAVPQSSDEFEAGKLGLQWQWQANPKKEWISLTAKKGVLRLYSQKLRAKGDNLWEVGSVLLEKFCGPEFTATTCVTLEAQGDGEKAGLVVMGKSYCYIAICKDGEGFRIGQYICNDADGKGKERKVYEVGIGQKKAYLRVSVSGEAVCQFSYSEDGKHFNRTGREFTARPGEWIGAKVGIFCLNPTNEIQGGYADFNWFRIS